MRTLEKRGIPRTGDERQVRTATRTVRKSGSLPARTLQADVVVIGAGIAGISAALEAARLGRRVILVEAQPVLGGQAVNSIVGMFCGLFSNGPHPYRFTRGIADQIVADLGRTNDLHYRRGAWTTLMYDVVALARWVEEQVRLSGIEVVLNSVLHTVSTEDRRLRSVDLVSRYGDIRVSADGFVDASGDASLVWHAGLPCREPADGPIYGSQMVIVENADVESLPTKKEMEERLRERGPAFGLVRTQGQVFPFPPRNTVSVNLTHSETPLDVLSAGREALDGKAQADRVLEFLKSEFPTSFGRARARMYGHAGVRQTRWIVGTHHLTVDEVRAGTRFPDAVARTAWPLEVHDTLQGYYWETFSEDHVHYVPFGSLTPPDVDNVVAAGRCIDGDVAALSSVRVMGPCIATGAAAAHALDLAGTGNVHEIDVDALQRRVSDNVERTDRGLE